MPAQSRSAFLSLKFALFVLAGLMLSATAAFSDPVYSNLILTNAGTAIGPDLIQVDDVLVPSSRDPSHSPILISSIAVDITSGAGFSTQFSLYLFPAMDDGTPSGGPVLIGTRAVTFTDSSQLVIFGNGRSLLSEVTPNFTAQPGFGVFYIGLSNSGPRTEAFDWEWANGPDVNLPTSYTYVVGTGELSRNTSDFPFPPNWSYSMNITAVPEPGSLFLLGTGLAGVLGVARRRLPNSSPQG